MPKRNFDVYEVDNGFKVSVRSAGEGNEMYDEGSVHHELVASSKEQVAQIFQEWLSGNDSPQLPNDPNQTTLGSRRLDQQHIPNNQGLHMSSGRIA